MKPKILDDVDRTWPEGFRFDQQPEEKDCVHSAAQSEGRRKPSACAVEEQLTKRKSCERDEQPEGKLDRIQRAAKDERRSACRMRDEQLNDELDRIQRAAQREEGVEDRT